MFKFGLQTTIISIIISHLIIFASCGPTQDLDIPPAIKTAAVFHGSADLKGKNVSYLEDPVGWSNLDQVFAAWNMPPLVVCVSGMWLLYGRRNFKTYRNDEVKLISGNELCINSAILPDVISMQPITPSTFFKEGVIALFPQANYGSKAEIISESESRDGGLKQLENLPRIGSVIVYGEAEWSLISAKGEIVCIRPRPKGDVGSNSICYEGNLQSVEIRGFHADAVYPECPEEHDEAIVGNVKLLNCKNFGTKDIDSLKVLAPRITRSSQDIVDIKCPQNMGNMSNVGNTGGTGNQANSGSNSMGNQSFSQEETALMQEMIKISLYHDFENREQILWPENELDIWKTTPLDIVYDIVMVTVPETIVNVEYLQRIREFTMYHLNEIWKAGNGTGGGGKSAKEKLFSWRRYKVIMYMLSKCLEMATANAEKYQMITATHYQTISSLESFKEQINPTFTLNPEHDLVIDTSYVVTNYAMALCHSAFEYNINFWDNFASTFHNMYFMPLEQKWKNPAPISPMAWRTILAGYGTMSQYQKIAFAATQMLSMTPNLKPMERWEE